jgi:hypothetical protein
MNLFEGTLVPVTLMAWSGATEKAPQHDETKVVKVTLEVILTPELASRLVPGDGEIKAVAYKAATNGTVRSHLRSASFQIAAKKQDLQIFSTPDSPAPTVAFTHVKVMKTIGVKINLKTATLVVRATVGPCGPQEYAQLGAWHRSQRFVTFTESDPALEFAGVDESDADEKARRRVVPTPAARPSSETDREGHRDPRRGRRRKFEIDAQWTPGRRRAARAVAMTARNS